VAELPGLDDLIRLPVFRGHDPYGILDCQRTQASFVPTHELHEEVDAFLLPPVSTLLGEPPCSA